MHQILILAKTMFLLFANNTNGSDINRPWIRIRWVESTPVEREWSIFDPMCASPFMFFEFVRVAKLIFWAFHIYAVDFLWGSLVQTCLPSDCDDQTQGIGLFRTAKVRKFHTVREKFKIVLHCPLYPTSLHKSWLQIQWKLTSAPVVKKHFAKLILFFVPYLCSARLAYHLHTSTTGLSLPWVLSFNSRGPK